MDFDVFSVYNRARILLDEKDDSTPFETDKLVKKWYRVCMNETRIETLGVKPLLNSLDILGGWPVLENLDENSYESFKWYDQVRKLAKEGFSVNTVMKHKIGADDRNNSYRVLKLDQPKLGLDREYLIAGFDDQYVQHYYNYMIDAAVLLGANKTKAMIELKESLLFEIALANISTSKQDRRDPNKLYNPVTIGELDEDKFGLNGAGQPASWLEHIAGMIKDVISYNEENVEYFNKDISVDSNEIIILKNPNYFKNVSQLIHKTDPKTIANYMGWRVVKSRMKYLNADAQDIKQKYDKAVTGKARKEPMWKQCLKSAGFNEYGGDGYNDFKAAGAASSMYVRRYFVPEEKQVMIDMIQYIRQRFGKMLDNVDWMDNTTLIEANKKLEQMDQLIAYPDEIINPKLMNDLYQGIQPKKQIITKTKQILI